MICVVIFTEKLELQKSTEAELLVLGGRMKLKSHHGNLLDLNFSKACRLNHRSQERGTTKDKFHPVMRECFNVCLRTINVVRRQSVQYTV